jgi:hypothetical protein
VGKACVRPRRKLCTKGDEALVAPEFFLVNNMKLSRRGECLRKDLDQSGLVVTLDVLGELVATTTFGLGFFGSLRG